MQPHRLSDEFLGGVASLPSATTKTVASGKAPLFAAGARADYVHVVESGLLSGSREPHKGLLFFLGAGSIAGPEALAGEATYRHTVRIRQVARIVSVPANELLSWCNLDAGRWREMLLAVAAQHEATEQRIERLCGSGVRQRLLDSLLEIAELTEAGADPYPVVRLPQHEIATYIGATRETTTMVLNSLAREGVVSLGYKCIALTRAAGPETRAAVGS